MPISLYAVNEKSVDFSGSSQDNTGKERHMEIKKCVQCGGNLERQAAKNAWLCPYCGARYEEEDQKERTAPKEYCGLNEEVFKVESDLSKIMKDRNGAGVINSITHCMRSFEKACQVEAYMLGKLTFSDDISVKGVREDQIEKAMPLLEKSIDPDERVIVYGNKGILSKGKEYFAVTDRRSIFVKRKSMKTVLHTDIDSLRIESCGNCYLNDDYEKGFVNLDAKGTFQGAMIALICMLSFEAQPDRDRIRIL